MSFDGAEYYRRKAALFKDGQKDWIPSIESEWVAGQYAADVKALCDHIDKQSQVVEAARALISAYNGLGVLCLYTDEFSALHASLNALEEESE